MIIKLICPCCKVEHNIIVPDIALKTGTAPFICPETGRKAIIHIKITVQEETTFASSEIEEATLEARNQDWKWKIEEANKIADDKEQQAFEKVSQNSSDTEDREHDRY